ncbi:hypothetical protein JOF34_001145 [Microbacterium amylolyticum]|uniref:Uncharacterized protein n=1 Tax=Microbacterium amylolyticum TaxID=936337 RepID=A0ABS4ZH02_9MICO|nr:hypothetical protein [Microbacterium amylolyticum]
MTHDEQIVLRASQLKLMAGSDVAHLCQAVIDAPCPRAVLNRQRIVQRAQPCSERRARGGGTAQPGLIDDACARDGFGDENLLRAVRDQIDRARNRDIRRCPTQAIGFSGRSAASSLTTRFTLCLREHGHTSQDFRHRHRSFLVDASPPPTLGS